MRYVSHDGLTFDLDDDGPEDGEVVLLLHGWPQDRTAWAKMTPQLTAQGLRVVAPDLRGTSPGARPPHYRDYEMRHLVGDALALVDATGAERVHLVGHDWGGALAWAFAERHPQRLSSLTVLSTAHPAAMLWAFRHGGQWKHSWYMLVFALPKLPAAVLRRFAHPLLTRLGLPKDQVAHHTRRLSGPGGPSGAAQGGLNWYRAMIGSMLPRPGRGRGGSKGTATGGAAGAETGRPAGPRLAQVPTAYVWGSKDPAFGRPVAERTRDLLQRGLGSLATYVEMRAAHWLPERHADEMSDLVLAQVRAAREQDAA